MARLQASMFVLAKYAWIDFAVKSHHTILLNTPRDEFVHHSIQQTTWSCS